MTMEMALMQRAALSQLVVAEASSSNSRSTERFGECGNSGGLARFCTAIGLSSASSLKSLNRRTISCRSSGGTRRDDSKIVAGTSKRRPRHMKGVTPTKDELFDELQAEEEADEELERFDAMGGTSIGDDDNLDEFIDSIEEDAKDGSGESKDEDSKGETISGTEEVVDAGDNTYVVKFKPDGKNGSGGKVGTTGTLSAQDRASDVSSKAQDTTEEVTDKVQVDL
jgi:hypothetical protein